MTRFATCLALLLIGLTSKTSRAAEPAEIVFTPDIVYGKGAGEELKLNLARPKDEQRKNLPCIVFIHGGGWGMGKREMHDEAVREVARRGLVGATVTYRLAPQHRFPAQVHDVKCAIRFLRAHADKYGIDPDRIAACGFSAGGHLAMMLGVTQKADGLEGDGGWAEQSSSVRAVVAYFGPVDLAAPDIPKHVHPITAQLIGGSAKEKPEEYKRASPITYVDAGDAPTLMFQGTKDPLVPHTQAYRMLDALSAAGVPGRGEILVGAGHGWGAAEWKRTAESSFAFLAEHLKPDDGGGEAGHAPGAGPAPRAVDSAPAPHTIPTPAKVDGGS